ncbi:hypothetical protein [Catenulispora subtropica]|uniref:Uncharacterized protein n=1 Tax=Catenulispora subtropica TaxID=450798 RepID=A0ABN2QWW4_9ACTN
MAAVLRLPSYEALPGGAHRIFILELFRLYRLAGRPPLREIEEKVLEMVEETDLTVSRETIRRTLQAKTIPRWASVEAMLVALASIAKINPDEKAPDIDRDDELFGTYRERLNQAWNDAIDYRPEPLPPVLANPWTSSDPWQPSEEPPF